MRRLEIAVMSAAAVAASIYLAFWPDGVEDYAHDAGPTLHPLINGDVTAALAHQPAMGWVSILLRVPFAFAARHGSRVLEYHLGTIPCLLVAAALSVALAARMRANGRPLATAALVLAIAAIGPMNWHAVAVGHPEEIVGAALCVAAVLSAASGRAPVTAGVLLGLALATKQWAVLVIGPALIAAPRGKPTIAATGIALGGALTVIPVVAGTHGVLSPATSIAPAFTRTQPASIWWALGHAHHFHAAGLAIETRTIPLSISRLTHPGIVALGFLLPLALLATRHGRRPSTENALTLLALLFLLRCVLDPMTVGYYHLPFVLSLLALEALHRRGLPLLSVLANGVLWLLITRVPWGTEPGRVATIYLAWALPMAAYLAARLYAPSVISVLGKWLRISLPSSVTTTRSSIRTPNAPGM